MEHKQRFMAYMDANGVKYTDVDAATVTVTYVGNNLSRIPVTVVFGDGDIVLLYCREIVQCRAGTTAFCVNKCNILNGRYRWVKFYLDDDSEVVAQIDAELRGAASGALCLSLVKRMAKTIDEGYAEFARHGPW